MPFSIKWEESSVYCKFTGEVTGQELFECNMALYDNPIFDDIRFQVFDMLCVTKFSFMPNDVKKVAAFDRAAGKIWPRMKCALVSTNQITLELSKSYQNEMRNSPWETKSFQVIDEALEWFSQPQ